MAGRRGQQETGTSVRKQHSPARDETIQSTTALQILVQIYYMKQI